LLRRTLCLVPGTHYAEEYEEERNKNYQTAYYTQRSKGKLLWMN
jgi:putative SOS response-associated peptidase YedK